MLNYESKIALHWDNRHGIEKKKKCWELDALFELILIGFLIKAFAAFCLMFMRPPCRIVN